MSWWRPGLPPGGVPSQVEIRALAIQATNGPVPLHASYESPLARWTPAEPLQEDVLQATFAGAACVVWTTIGELDQAASYGFEVESVVRDVAGAAMSLECYLIPHATSGAVGPFQLDATKVTLGTGADYQALTFAGTVPLVRVPGRLAVVVTSGSVVAAHATPYLIRSVRRTISEI